MGRAPYRLALIGFGNVGRALVGLLVDRRSELAEMRIDYTLVGVATRGLGFLAESDGLDMPALLRGEYPQRTADFDSEDVGAWLEGCGADLLFELSVLKPLTGEPATSHIAAALSRAVHVVTANKGPLVHGYRRLTSLAQSHGVSLRFEAANADSIPIYSTFRETLPLSRVESFRGVLNCTSSVVLDAIAAGGARADGVRRAQELGIAEADPSFDLDGWDCAVKVVALANILIGADLALDDVHRVGIDGIGTDALRAARAAGDSIRLVSRIATHGDEIRAGVGPERMPPDDPLNIDPLSLGLHFEFVPGLLPALTLIGHRLDPPSTAYGALCDFISIARPTP